MSFQLRKDLRMNIKQMFGTQDMTVGKPMSVLLRFSVPLLVGNLAQQLYNTVDSIIVGKYIGDTALAAVGTAGPIFFLLLTLLMGISTGAGILSAQYFGAKDRNTLSRVVGSSFFLILSSGIVMTAVGYFCSGWMIHLIQPPEEVAKGAIIYLQIIFLGYIGNSAYNILAGILRGMGDSFYPLVYLVAACLLNIILDLVLVKNMGIAGVALATIIAQALSGALCVIRICRLRDTVDLNRKTLKPDMDLTLKLCRLGLPAGLTQAIFSLSAIIVQSLTNSMGEAVIAANVAIMRVDGFCMLPNFTFGTAATTYTGQNIGAGKADRLSRGTKDLLKIALLSAGILVAGVLLFGRTLIGLFTETETVMEIGVMGLRWLALGYLCFSISQVLQGMMRGAGETMLPMWISIISTVILRLPLAYLIAGMTKAAEWPNGHPVALFSSLLISWIAATVISIFVYVRGMWRRRLPKEIQEAMGKKKKT